MSPKSFSVVCWKTLGFVALDAAVSEADTAALFLFQEGFRARIS
jgi:hypothetical protein